ncbi:hypothetical protein FRC15_008040 [Serendipita sp. 397]|nr:hypothetical protein FRC15_008040 [Serendipita sp. 397]
MVTDVKGSADDAHVSDSGCSKTGQVIEASLSPVIAPAQVASGMTLRPSAFQHGTRFAILSQKNHIRLVVSTYLFDIISVQECQTPFLHRLQTRRTTFRSRTDIPEKP